MCKPFIQTVYAVLLLLLVLNFGLSAEAAGCGAANQRPCTISNAYHHVMQVFTRTSQKTGV